MNPFVVTKRAQQNTPNSTGFSVNPAVSALYRITVSQNLANATEVIVDWNSAVYDLQSTVTVGANWEFKAPVDGFYMASGYMKMIGPGGGWGAGSSGNLLMYYSDAGAAFVLSKYVAMCMAQAATTMNFGLTFSAGVYLKLGDKIHMRAYQTSGGTATTPITSTEGHISIFRIGGVT